MTVQRVRQQFAAEGLDASPHRKKPTGRAFRKLDGEQEARLVTLACSQAPKGHARRTMALLADRLVEISGVDSIDPATAWRTLQKNEIKPWLKQQWVIPPKANAASVANTEDVLDTYAKPYDALRPVVCVGEGGKQSIGEVREPLPVRPGSPAKEDCVDERGGMADLLLAFEPLAGARRVGVTDRKTGVDFARFLRTLSDTHRAAEGRAGLRRPEHPHAGGAVRGVRAGGGAAARGAVRVALHAETRELAERGGDGAGRARPAVPGPAHLRRDGAQAGGSRGGEGPERGGCEGRVTVHYRRRPRETQKTPSYD